MPSIRRAKIEDLHEMQNCNLWCLPENYNFKYYLYHYASWAPQLFVAEENNQVCGYVLSKMDDENDDTPEVTDCSYRSRTATSHPCRSCAAIADWVSPTNS